MKTHIRPLTLPDDWQERKEEILDELFRRWEEAWQDGGDPAPRELCPEAPDELLAELAEGIELLKQFSAGFEQSVEGGGSDAASFRADGLEGIDDVAEGGQGRVILARDTRLGRQVAIKILKDSLGGSLDRFEREARITGELEHPGVIPVYGFGQDEQGQPYYAMRYVPHRRTMAAAIDELHQIDDPSEYAVAFQKLLRKFVTVCTTIEYAHTKHVIHRDLKPQNILLGDYDEVFVVDFGIAKPMVGEESTRADSVGAASAACGSRSSVEETLPAGSRTFGALGTPAYMSPEQTEEAARAGKSSDVYGLGATLYHLLTGRPPFTGKSSNDVMAKVRAGDVSPPRIVNHSVPPALQAICLKAMHVDPTSRYESAGGLAADLEKWLAGEPVEAWPEPLSARTLRWVRRHRTLVTGAVAALVVFVVVASIAALSLDAARRREVAAKNREIAANEKLAAANK